MASAFFNALVDPTRGRGISAGTQPAERIHAEVAATMNEIGIALDDAAPQRLTDDLARTANILVTMGCGEVCPVVPGLKRIDWELPDPKGLPPERVRIIRDTIKQHVEQLIEDEGLASGDSEV
jgi:arsenate reductase